MKERLERVRESELDKRERERAPPYPLRDSVEKCWQSNILQLQFYSLHQYILQKSF